MKRSVYSVCAGLMATFVSLSGSVFAEDSSEMSDQTTVESRQLRPQTTPAEVQRAVATLNQRPGYQKDSQPPTAKQTAFVQTAADSSDNKKASTTGVVVDSREDPAKRKPTSQNSFFRMVSAMFQAPVPPPQPVQPIQPTLPTTPESGAAGSSISQELGGGEQLAKLTSDVQVATKQQTQSQATSDMAAALTQTDSVQTVEVQHRSPVSADPYIRGYKGGEIYTQADGVYWTPARRDLDTMLNKIDPDMMQNVTVVPGPYGLRYGPGLAFIDVTRQPAPRYECGFESHFDTSGSVRSNGGQIYGRETALPATRIGDSSAATANEAAAITPPATARKFPQATTIKIRGAN